MKKWARVYADYFMPSRLQEYEDLILEVKDAGYKQTSVRDAWDTIRNFGRLNSFFVHRHEIDTDVATAKNFLHWKNMAFTLNFILGFLQLMRI